MLVKIFWSSLDSKRLVVDSVIVHVFMYSVHLMIKVFTCKAFKNQYLPEFYKIKETIE